MRGNGSPGELSAHQRRAAIARTWHPASDTARAVRYLCGGGTDGQPSFLTGMLPTVGREAKFIGRVGAELDLEAGQKAARLATLNALAVARQHLGSLDKVTRVVRLGVAVATSGDVREQAEGG